MILVLLPGILYYLSLYDPSVIAWYFVLFKSVWS